MNDKVVQLVPTADAADNLGATLRIVDDLRQALISGKVKAFCGVGIAPDHETHMWCSSVKPTTRLEMMGALSRLNALYRKNEA